jgi:hypothetical protein
MEKNLVMLGYLVGLRGEILSPRVRWACQRSRPKTGPLAEHLVGRLTLNICVCSTQVGINFSTDEPGIFGILSMLPGGPAAASGMLRKGDVLYR